MSKADRGHGSPYDRGSADRYYQRSRRPHSFTPWNPSGEGMTQEQIDEYNRGYSQEEDRKNWD